MPDVELLKFNTANGYVGFDVIGFKLYKSEHNMRKVKKYFKW